MSTALRRNKPISLPDVRFKRGAITRYNGVSALRVAQAVFEFGGTDSSGVSMATAAAHGLGVYIPDNAIVVDAWIDVVTTFTSATSDTATLAVKIQTANDVVAAIAIADATNVWDAGVHGTKINNFALDGNALTQVAMAAARSATHLKLTAEREITVTVGVEAITAGKMVIYVAYLLGD